VRFSQLVVEQPWIKEIDINPLLASPERLVALDARILLHTPTMEERELPRPAIHPYPQKYAGVWLSPKDEEITIRPIRPEDEPLLAEFNQTLTPDSIYLRYFHPISAAQLVSHEQLARLCFIDYDREMNLVAERIKDDGKSEILGLGQLTKLHGSRDAEFAILISDSYQRQGLGTELLTRLVEFGRDEDLEQIVAEILPENEGMKRVSSRLGFDMHMNRNEGVIEAKLVL
jgi:acetyltransferase